MRAALVLYTLYQYGPTCPEHWTIQVKLFRHWTIQVKLFRHWTIQVKLFSHWTIQVKLFRHWTIQVCYSDTGPFK